jgi:hypothetical protein
MKYLSKITILVLLLVSQFSANAQCAMCKATAESNPNVGGGLNAGIEYILIIPYILLGAFVFIVLKGKMKPFWKDLTGKNKDKKQEFTAENWY